MTIATWNIERVRTSYRRFDDILDYLRELNADILILTETNAAIDLGSEYTAYHSAPLPLPEKYYHADERRVSIYSKYPCIGTCETYRGNTAICHVFDTPHGQLAVYATVIGIYGNRRKDFPDELKKQIADIDSIAAKANICIAGDFNMSFSDNYYFTTEGRQKLNDCFSRNKLMNLTASIPQNIDHIAISEVWLGGREAPTSTWNDPVDKKISDHKGVRVSIE